MFDIKRPVAVLSAAVMLLVAATATAENASKAHKQNVEATEQGTSVLWHSPDDIQSRNLVYGQGGEEDAPHTTYTFVQEDMEGTSPKLTVRDENGVRWKVKMGPEARPETVASRLVWAVGYTTNEDYFLPSMHVEGLPAHLHRGQQFVDPDGTLHDVRLKRYLQGEKKIGIWKWSDNPFVGSKELSGLKVMMALINNWDVKDDNNAVYREKNPKDSDGPENVYMVSDLGASFGTTGLNWTQHISKGNLDSYSHSKMISKVAPDYVDFNMPTRASVIHIFTPPEYIRRLELRWVGKHVPRADVRWITQYLVQLSPQQIRDAFRAAGYPPDQVEGYARVVENRIAELKNI